MKTTSTSDWSMAFVLKDSLFDSWVYLHNVLQSCGGKESPAQFPNYISPPVTHHIFSQVSFYGVHEKLIMFFVHNLSLGRYPLLYWLVQY